MDLKARRPISELLRWNVAARVWISGNCVVSNGMYGIAAVCGGKFLSLILQKQGDEDGCTTELAVFAAKGTFRARFPIVIRMKGQGSI